jgi:hypothetical protein
LTRFADHLYEDLMREHGAALQALSDDAAAAPARQRRRRAARPAWLTAGVAAATAAAALGFVLFGGSAGAAYAVTQNADGTVSVAVHDVSAIGAANIRLKALGVHAVVVPVRAGCPSLEPLLAAGQPGWAVSARVHKGGDTVITVSAERVPADETLVLGFEDVHGGTISMAGLIEGRVPGCISLPASGGPPQSGSGRQGTTVKP